MSKPLVSIIVPTYNVERYIEECIDSLLNQTYQPIEIIVIDDGSKDATLYLLKQYQDQIQLISHTVNKGQGARRNEGLKKASGKYIYFVDSDDWIEKQTVEAAVSQLEKTGADLVRFNARAFHDGHEASQQEQNPYDFAAILKDKAVYEGPEALEKNRKSYSASPCLYIATKECIDKLELKFIEGVLHEDEYYTTRLFASVTRLTYLNEHFYHRRYRLASTMTEQSKMHKLRSFESYIKVFKALEEEYEKDSYTQEQQAFIKRQLLSIYNGLQTSPVEPILKKQLRDLKSVSQKDKVYLSLARLKHKLNKGQMN